MKFRRLRIRPRRKPRALRVERLPSRRVLAAITGTVFDDLNGSMNRDDTESGLVARLVFLDQNANAIPDAGEPLTLTAADGSFRFDDLSDGTYRVAIFNGTQTQSQTTPVSSRWIDTVAGFTDGRSVVPGPSGLLRTETSLVVPGDSQIQEIDLPSGVTSAVELPGGQVLVVRASDGQGPTSGTSSFVIDLATGEQTPVDLDGGQDVQGYHSLAVAESGSGVLIEDSGESFVPVRTIDVSDSASMAQVTVTSTMVPSGTEAFVSDTGVRAILASPNQSGTEVRLWSNQTGTLVHPTSFDLDRTTEVAAFDDDAGLLAMRTDDGGLRLFDVDANFAPLFGIPSVDGPVLLDASHDRLLVLSASSASLRVFDLDSGSPISDIAMDLSGLGVIQEITAGRLDGAVRILGSAGLVESRINAPTAAEITIDDQQSVDGILFGLSIDGPNDPPEFSEVPRFEVLEDHSLVELAPRLTLGTFGNDNDAYVLVPVEGAQNGSAQVSPAGGLTYVPHPNFHGQDSIMVALHDGQSLGEPVEIVIDVVPVPEAPLGIELDIHSIPENLRPQVPFGSVEVIDPDGFNHDFFVSDSRFAVQDGQLVLVNGSLDFETEPSFSLTLRATDRETGDRVSLTRQISVSDSDDPITQILPTHASVDENVAGAEIAMLTVVDQDSNQAHELSVDDDRFVVEGRLLRLADDVSLDYETTPTITVGVTATPEGGGLAFTGAVTIRVNDRMEQPTRLDLTDLTVLEWTYGAGVGNILIDNTLPHARFDLSVSDSRFSVDNGLLKLLDSEYVRYDAEPIIPLTVTAADRDGEFASISQYFQIQVLPNEYVGHNIDNPFDVDMSDSVTPRDVHHIIDHLNEHGPGPVGPDSLPEMMDVNADGLVTPIDALLVINRINQERHGGPSVGGEAEDDDSVDAPPKIRGGEGEQGITDSPTDTDAIDRSASDEFVREFRPYGPLPIDDADDDDDEDEDLS